jgi:hypothetical protein
MLPPFRDARLLDGFFSFVEKRLRSCAKALSSQRRRTYRPSLWKKVAMAQKFYCQSRGDFLSSFLWLWKL